MSIKLSKNGYTRLPTVDPDSPESSERKGKAPRSLRPGLFYMFGDRGKYLRDHSDSEDIEMTEMRPRRPKRRLRSPKSPKSTTKMKYNTIEEPILPGDTVQRVALRYGCPVSFLLSYVVYLRLVALQVTHYYYF